MRLLNEDQQHRLWTILHDGLSNREDIPFRIPSQHLGTISGQKEAYYAVLSSNFIEGSIDGYLRCGSYLSNELDPH